MKKFLHQHKRSNGSSAQARLEPEREEEAIGLKPEQTQLTEEAKEPGLEHAREQEPQIGLADEPRAEGEREERKSEERKDDDLDEDLPKPVAKPKMGPFLSLKTRKSVSG